MARSLFYVILIMTALFISCTEQELTEEERINRYISDKNLEMQKTTSGIYYQLTKPGTEEHPGKGATLNVRFRGTLLNGKEFTSVMDNTTPLKVALSETIKGWQQAVPLLGKGGKGLFIIPSELAYGDREIEGVPANSPLIYEIELIDFYEQF